jgi:hypothetical protein
MQNEIRQDKIMGSRRFSNYFWSFFLLVGGLGFLLAGISTYLKIKLLPFSNTTELSFIPQGLVMIFYGALSLGISCYIIFTLILDIGSGYNEYNKIEKIVKIIRKGFPGKNRQVLLTYPLSNIRSIGIKMTEGLNPTRSIYLCLKDERNIPLTSVQEPISISNFEEEANNLAKFLDLKLENL